MFESIIICYPAQSQCRKAGREAPLIDSRAPQDNYCKTAAVYTEQTAAVLIRTGCNQVLLSLAIDAMSPTPFRTMLGR